MEVRSVLQIRTLICGYDIDNRIDPKESSIVNIGAACRTAIRSAQSRAESSEEREGAHNTSLEPLVQAGCYT